MAESEIDYRVCDRVGVLRLNRPERRNAMTLGMVDRIAEIILQARTDERVNVLVLTGAGNAFCSGVDLSILTPGKSGLTASPLEIKTTLSEHVHRVAHAIEDFDKPLIAAVNGPAVGAGMDLALMADMRIASSSATFVEGYIRVGLVPGAGGCHFLPRVVGYAKAIELLLTGDAVDAAEAQAIGLVNRLVPDEELERETAAFAARLAGVSPLAARMIKRATRQSERLELRASLDMISSHMGIVTATADASEALSAMRERRNPVFQGR